MTFRRNPAAIVMACLLGLAVLLRLASMAWLPLMDTTEARYSEIARKMFVLGDWITPWHGNLPFWGKPPLSFWLTAGSFKLFGVSEFAARLPHFLCLLAVALLVWLMAASRSRREGWLALALLASSALFFVSAGAVMTDGALVVGTTLAMRAFWVHLHRRAGTASLQWQLFLGLSIGLLAKGPLVLVLFGLPIAAWSMWRRRVAEVWASFNWVVGMASAILLVSPWYLLAEAKTPGFLEYFLVGEHWHRFMTPGWKGDLYGTAHQFAPGTIWIFAIAAASPWSVLLPWVLTSSRRSAPAQHQLSVYDRDWFIYLVCWALVPLVFFTAARNVIWTYVLPALPAMALLVAQWLERSQNGVRAEKIGAGCIALTMVGALVFGAKLYRTGTVNVKSAKALVHEWQEERSPDELLVVVGPQMHSAAFYSNGEAQVAKTLDEAYRILGSRSGYIAVRLSDVSQEGAARAKVVGKFGDRELLYIATTYGATR